MRNRILRIICAALLLCVAIFLEKTYVFPLWGLFLVYLIPYLVVAYNVVAEAGEALFKGKAFDENFLMTIATLGALAIGFLPGSENEFLEAVLVMLLYQTGELFEHLAAHRSRRSISELMDLRPDVAHVERGGEVLSLAPGEILPGEIIQVLPGEKIPMDSVVLEGSSMLDTSSLTGESVPLKVHIGSEILSGCINLSGLLRARVSKSFGESTASKIIELVEHAGERKSQSESFISRFAKIYTPCVVLAAVVIAVVPPIISPDFIGNFSTWLYRALTFLIVSCPCALVISIPLTFFAGIGGASRRGILIKGGNYVEALAKAGTVVFDKTGTLTHGTFSVQNLYPEEIEASELLGLAACAEQFSSHPIALSLRKACGKLPDVAVEQVEETAGLGVRATVGDRVVGVGNAKFMELMGCGSQCHAVVTRIKSVAGSLVHVSLDGNYAGCILIADALKADAFAAVRSLHSAGVSRTVMLTGDRREVGEKVAVELGIDQTFAELLPAGKVSQVEILLQSQSPRQTLVFVGDGINDAPVLARADVGIAMGALGSDAAIEAADVVLMDDKPSQVAKAVTISKEIVAIARQNVVFSLFVKFLVLILALVGLAPMWLAVFADVGICLLTILNAMRALRL